MIPTINIVENNTIVEIPAAFIVEIAQNTSAVGVESGNNVTIEQGTTTVQVSQMNIVSVNEELVNIIEIGIQGPAGSGGGGGGSWGSITGTLSDQTDLQTVLDSKLESYTVTQSDVTTHQAALTLTESQISDLDHYEDADAVTALTGQNISIFNNNSGYITDYTVTVGDVTAHEASINHDALTNYVANEHIDWTGATDNLVTTGDGSFGTATIGGVSNNAQIDSAGVLRFSGTGAYDVATNSYAFRADAANLAGLKFEASGGNGFPFLDTGGNRIAKSFLSGGSDGGAGGYWALAGFANEEITPAQLTGNVNNYTGFKDNGFASVNSSTNVNITGIGAPVQTKIKSRMTYIYNDGTSGNNITLKHEDTNSTATNRFKCVTGADIVLADGEGAMAQYSPSAGRWLTHKL